MSVGVRRPIADPRVSRRPFIVLAIAGAAVAVTTAALAARPAGGAVTGGAMTGVAVAGAAVADGAMTGGAMTRGAMTRGAMTGSPPKQSVAGRTATDGPRPAVARCGTPAPRTAAGYAELFRTLDRREWGGGDVALSVPIGGRSVWLFGDTLSTYRFVHSSAITQDGGCLHVSHGGGQLLPDQHVVARPTRAEPSRIYWIVGARRVAPDRLAVTARAIDIVGTGPWDFRDGGSSRTALLTVDAAGDVTFERWLKRTLSPPPPPGLLLDCDAAAPPIPHHVCYAEHRHPELRLAGGRVLVTVSQNWDDGRLHPFADYQPLFRAG
jgi:hypothetical protein